MTGRDSDDPVRHLAGRVADDVASDVLAAALEQARERATERLARLLTEEIVARALEGAPPGAAAPPLAGPRTAGPPEPVAGPEGPTAEEPPLEEPTAEVPTAEVPRTALYAYAVTRADVDYPADGPGLTDGRPVMTVTDDDLGLLVSRVDPEELRVDPDDLSESGRLAVLARGHDSVVRTAVAAGPVLPLRFGTVVADEQGARQLLRAHADAARDRLARIGDAHEWGIRLVRALEEPALTGPRPDREDMSGTEFLTRRREAQLARTAAARAAGSAADRVEESLAPHVRESLRRGGAPGSSLLLDVACLVPAADDRAFLAAVDRLSGELRDEGLDLDITGPWPPYSFAALGAPDGA
jgi:Gas vesicle synthesis protein GvpL/GvpF